MSSYEALQPDRQLCCHDYLRRWFRGDADLYGIGIEGLSEGTSGSVRGRKGDGVGRLQEAHDLGRGCQGCRDKTR